ncbi:MAG: Gx transporter family protein [Lachnospiraceae bacterium]|nr:Gx transporter family protein [Lachnospiraceae bacterium]
MTSLNEIAHSKEKEKKTVPQEEIPLSYLGFFLALAVIFGYVESLVPVPIPIPGIKLGLPNLVITAILYAYSFKAALIITIVRVFIIGFLFGNLFSIMYGLCGAILSLLFMALAKRTGMFRIAGVSALGGVMHNVGQCLMAFATVRGFPIMWYLPILMLAGLAAGILTGIADALIIPRIHRYGVR